MTPVRRITWILALTVFLIISSGCASTNLRWVNEEINRQGTSIHKEEGQRIQGYLLSDGTREEYKGRVRLADQDSLVFWGGEVDGEGKPAGDGHGGLDLGFVFPQSAVKALEVKEKRVGMTVLLVTGIVVVVGVVVMAVAYPKETVAEAGTLFFEPTAGN